MAEISIIIPVYNSSRYLSECLDSVRAQTLQDIEIICINDGSTDDSLEILLQYQDKDSRIIVINQPNAGVSAARNTGLDITTGRYIGFIDSDDTVEKEFFETLFNSAEAHGTDLVFSIGLGGAAITADKRFTEQEIREMILPLYFKEDGHNAIWNKLYSAEVIRKNNIRFPVGRTHGEDAEFNIHFLMHASNLYALDYSGYHYRETPGSATRNVIQFDYLQQAVETFQKDWSPVIGKILAPCTLGQLKKERFVNTIISLIYITSNPENGLSLKSRLSRLGQIVRHGLVKQLFNENNQDITTSFPRYKKEIYRGIRSQSVITLYLLSLYSYYRNL